MKFTFRQLEVFVAIARGENVSQAALAIPLSQSATSAALAELERQFGQPGMARLLPQLGVARVRRRDGGGCGRSSGRSRLRSPLAAGG